MPFSTKLSLGLGLGLGGLFSSYPTIDQCIHADAHVAGWREGLTYGTERGCNIAVVGESDPHMPHHTQQSKLPDRPQSTPVKVGFRD